MVTAQKQEPAQSVDKVRIRVPVYPSASTIQDAVETYIAKVRGIPGLEEMVISIHGDMVYAEIVANGLSFDDGKPIYAAQLEISDHFPEILWDFAVTDRKGADLGVPDPARYQVISLQLQPA